MQWLKIILCGFKVSKPFYKQFFLGYKNEDGSHQLGMVGSNSLGNMVALGKWAHL
jgi:hypothetical protein